VRQANAVFNRYLAEAKVEDIDGLRLLPLFLSVRAAIRAHVLFMKSEHAEDGEAGLARGQALFRSGRTPHHAEAADVGCDRRPVGDWKVGSRARSLQV
jgi:hypothetical protein